MSLHRKRVHRLVMGLFAVTLVSVSLASAADDTPFRFGFSKLEITPTEPVRLSGYSNRDHAYEGIEEPLFVRVMALTSGQGAPYILASVDTIGFPGVLTREVFEAIEARHQLPRANFVLASTHSHLAPHTGSG